MIPYRGRISFRQYMPAKPTKYGIKVWMAADSSNGFVLDFNFYLGKEAGPALIHGLGYRVVTKLIQPFMNRNHHIFFDNYFTSRRLMEHLESQQTFACGTVRINRKGIPPCAKQKLKPGEKVMQQKAPGYLIGLSTRSLPFSSLERQPRANLNSKHLLRYEENRETITRGGRTKRTHNLAFDEIESESSAKRARYQAEGSGEDVGTMAEDVGETDIEERKDQFLRTVERLLKPSERKRHVIGGEKKKELGWRKVEEYIESRRDKDVVDPDPNKLYTRRKERQSTSSIPSETDQRRVKFPDNGWTTSLDKMPMFTKAEMNSHVKKSGKTIGNTDHHSVPTGLRKAKTFLQDEYLHEIKTANDQSRVNRGTPVYMAPELLVGDIQLPFANLEDLKRADMWALGMTLFVLLNPGTKYPYKREFEQPRDHRKSVIDQLEILLKNKQHPVELLKYQHQHSTNWYTIYKIYEACTSFDARARPDVSTVLKLLDQENRDTSINHHLHGSQASALEYHDEMVARNIQRGKHASDIVAAPPIHSDGTNACAFLSMMIAHKIHQVAGNGRPAWPEICEVPEKVIDELPKKINSHRNIEEHYDVIEAYRYSILKQAKCEIDNYAFSEEFVDPHYVFSQKGMSALKSAIISMTTEKLTVAIYTCEPIIFLIGFTGGHVFLLDTRPVSESVGGRRKGMLKLFPATNEASVEEVCLWLWRRLHSSGVKNDSYQSFAFMSKVERALKRKYDTCGDQNDDIHITSSNTLKKPWERSILIG
ncbi:hypothetical protein QZH41_003200 [Actinostola sp. cb2023]|nr:hypothetical protein QZH41_003200 [Actinostola sp. cb2023]